MQPGGESGTGSLFERNTLSQMDDITPRQAELLAAVTQFYIKSGRPVGSRYLCEKAGIDLSPSTVRNELAGLEERGYLDHPHTSAGRVPTDKGYRYFVDNLTEKQKRTASALAALDHLTGEMEEALRDATTVLARATGLLAMASLPAPGNASIKHIEVLKLSSEMIVVVVITAAGDVTKRMIVFEDEVDSGLVDWARGFLNDAFGGMDLGSRMLKVRLDGLDLDSAERGFIDAIMPALAQAPDSGNDVLLIEGAAHLVSQLETSDDPSLLKVIRMLDRQDKMLELLRAALQEYRVCLRIGSELPASDIQNCSLVAAGYGPAHRNLGTVGVLGPKRMDYPTVIGSVEATARSLSDFIEEIFQRE